MSESKSAANAWETRGIYVRLSKRRKARLLEIAKELGHEDSPHRALSAYIGDPREAGAPPAPAPLNSDRGSFQDFDGVDEMREEIMVRLDKLARDFAAMEDRMLDTLSRIGDALAPFRTPLSDAAPSMSDPESLAVFLAAAQAAGRMPIDRIALIQAEWASTTGERDLANATATAMSMGFSLVLLSVDGRPATTRASGSARITGIDAGSRMAARVHASPSSPLIFACRPVGEAQWTVEAFSQRPDQTLGELLGTFAIG